MTNFGDSRIIKAIGTALFGAYVYHCVQTPDSFHIIGAVNTVIHEAGHIIFIFFGEFLHILGGSLTQVLIPLIFSAYFFYRRDVFAGAFIMIWLGESIVEVAHYAADAAVMQLPLLGGDSVIHDWNYLLYSTNLLTHTTAISNGIYSTGLFLAFVGVVICIATLFQKNAPQKEGLGN